MKIDVTITACLRPEILETTLRSFFDGMFRAHECRLIINVDPVGLDVPQKSVVDVCRSYSPVVVSRTPSEPSFPVAFKWVWMQVEAPYVFHLEDDWELLSPVSLSKMVELMESEPDLAVLRLPRWRTESLTSKNWGHFYPWNGRFFECPEGRKAELGFCGHPSLIRGDFVKKTTPYLDEGKNPEKQFHYNYKIVEVVKKYRYGVYATQNSPPIIREIGEQWKIANGWIKQGNRAHFVKWTRSQS
jgi:hypothetical protein